MHIDLLEDRHAGLPVAGSITWESACVMDATCVCAREASSDGRAPHRDGPAGHNGRGEGRTRNLLVIKAHADLPQYKFRSGARHVPCTPSCTVGYVIIPRTSLVCCNISPVTISGHLSLLGLGSAPQFVP